MKKLLDIAVLCGTIWLAYYALTYKPLSQLPPAVDMSQSYPVTPEGWEKENVR
jgi:hypothetical protein